MNEEFPALPSRSQPVRKFPRKESGTRTFSFRLPQDVAERLEEAALRAGVNASDFMRALLLDRLDGVDHLGERMERLADQVVTEFSRLQESLAVSVEAILVGATSGRKVTAEMAKRWADAHVRQVGGDGAEKD